MDPDQLTKDERLEAARKRFAEKQKKLHKPSHDPVVQPTEPILSVSHGPTQERPRQLTAEDLFGPSDSDPFYQTSFPQTSSNPVSQANPHAAPEPVKSNIPEFIPNPTLATKDNVNTIQSAPPFSMEQELIDELQDTGSPYSPVNENTDPVVETASTEPSISDWDNMAKPRQLLRPEHIFDFSLGSMQEISLEDNVDLNDEALEDLVFPATLLAPGEHASRIVDAPDLNENNQEKPFWESGNDDSYWNSQNHHDASKKNVADQELLGQESITAQDPVFPKFPTQETAEPSIFPEEDRNNLDHVDPGLSGQEEKIHREQVSGMDITANIPEVSGPLVGDDLESVSLHLDDRDVVLNTGEQDESTWATDENPLSTIEQANDDIKDKIKTLQEEKEAFQTTIKELGEQINQQSDSIEEFSTTIIDKDTKVDEQKSIIENQEARLNEQVAIIKELKDSLNKQNETIEQQKATIDEQNVTIEEQKTSITELSAKVEKLESKISEQETLIEKAKAIEPVATSDQSAIIEEQKGTIERMKKENTNLKLGRMDLNDRIAELEEELAELKSAESLRTGAPKPPISKEEVILSHPVKAELMGMQAYDPLATAIPPAESVVSATEAESIDRLPVSDSVPIPEAAPTPVSAPISESTAAPDSAPPKSASIDPGQTTFESLFGVSSETKQEIPLHAGDNSIAPHSQGSTDESTVAQSQEPISEIYGITDSVSKLHLDAAAPQTTLPTVAPNADTEAVPTAEVATEAIKDAAAEPATEESTPTSSADAIDPLDEFESMLQSVVQSHEKPVTAAPVATSKPQTQTETFLAADTKNTYAQSPRPEPTRLDTGADFRERLMVWKGWQVDMTNWTSGSNPKIAL